MLDYRSNRPRGGSARSTCCARRVGPTSWRGYTTPLRRRFCCCRRGPRNSALRVASPTDVHFAFALAEVSSGLFALATDDARDKLLLDFFADDAGPPLLELQLFGDRWSRVPLAECLGPTMDLGF
ncbi:MAG: hypothetical protein QM811_18820 [Pirellulales bacterium]